MSTIIVIEDEEQILKAISRVLEDNDYTVYLAKSVKEGLINCATRKPDLVILDLGLPDGDGLEVIEQLRTYTNIPIIVLSARDAESSKVQALELGADDYLTKPFGANELLARVKAQLRRANIIDNNPNQKIIFDDHTYFDLKAQMLYKNEQSIHLTKLELKLLLALLKEPNKILTTKHLMQEVWGQHYIEQQHYLRIYMNHLRQKLEDNPAMPKFVQTQSGVGYRLVLK